jgi:breast cancer 2 susceptibility protein
VLSDVTELNRMTPTLALYYTFDSSSHPSPAALTSTAPIIQWGSEQAFDELLRQGCSLATKAWVDNHWGLILWKLAGMLCLDPESEADPTTRRWTWAHVMKHLLYRYVFVAV